MKTYHVHISEILGLTISVEAEDSYEAVEKVEEMCCNGEINLDASNFVDRSVEVIY